MLSQDEIRRALLALAGEFARSSVQAEIAIMGGAAVVMLYGARAATKDVDAVILSPLDPKRVRVAVERVAAELGLPSDWLNDGAKGYVNGLALGDVIIDEPFLVVRALSAYQLLAMKLSAWRDDVDIEDARLLLTKVSTDRDEAWSLVEPHIVPGRELKAYYAFCDLWEARDESE